eukprot:scaffold20328_cov116-Isochrysis_galbana.AAC.5
MARCRYPGCCGAAFSSNPAARSVKMMGRAELPTASLERPGRGIWPVAVVAGPGAGAPRNLETFSGGATVPARPARRRAAPASATGRLDQTEPGSRRSPATVCGQMQGRIAAAARPIHRSSWFTCIYKILK